MRNLNQRLWCAIAAATTAAGVIGMTGCGMGSLASQSAVSGQGFGGVIMGGGQPVSGASIQLYSPSSNGYGATAAPLFNRVVTSDANGRFNFSGAYSCPSSATPV